MSFTYDKKAWARGTPRDHEKENASLYYVFNDPDREFFVLLKKDKTDKKWYVDASREDDVRWSPIAAANVKEAKAVAEIMGKME